MTKAELEKELAKASAKIKLLESINKDLDLHRQVNCERRDALSAAYVAEAEMLRWVQQRDDMIRQLMTELSIFRAKEIDTMSRMVEHTKTFSPSGRWKWDDEWKEVR